MSFDEKATWVSLVVAVVVPLVYFWEVLGQLGESSASEISYQVPLLIAIGASILLTIVGSIVMAVGTGIAIEVTGEGSTDEIGRKDERDIDISRRGDVVGYYVTSVGVVGALLLTMLEYDYFWIANALYVSFVVGAIVSYVVKLAAYRRGF